MQGIYVLLVDDEERFVSTTAAILNKKGLVTATAANGFAALEILKAQRVDVVVLDIKMPGLDGIDVLQEIKKRYPMVEVILLTGHGSVESAVDGLKRGAMDYLMKPCDIPVLLEKIEQAFLKKQKQEDKIRSDKVDKIVQDPWTVFENEPG